MESLKPFQDGIDYMTLHIDWANANSRFKPRDFRSQYYENYKDELTALYRGDDAVVKQQKTAYTLMRMDLEYKMSLVNINDRVDEIFGIKTKIIDTTDYFVTFNMDEKKFVVDKVLKAIDALKQKSWVMDFYGVMEYHGDKSNHPHLMCKITLGDKYKKWGIFKDKMKQTILFRNFMSGDNFLEIKKFESYHDDYLALDKSPKKQESLDMDIIWRQENSIPHFFKK